MKKILSQQFANVTVFFARMIVLFSLIASQFFGVAPQPVFATGVDVGIVLPTNGGRWLQDKDRLESALTTAGFSSEVLFSQDDVPTESANVTSLLANNPSLQVLIICPVDGAAAAATVAAARVAKPTLKIIAYDRLITGTPALDFFVTFDSISVGRAQGQYLVDHAGAGSGKPLYLYAGSATDNNAFQFFEGAWSVLQPKIANGTFIIENSSAAVTLKSQPTLTHEQQAAIFDQIAVADWDPNNAKNLAVANLGAVGAGGKGNVFILAPNDGTARSIADVFAADSGVTSYMITGQDADWDSVPYIMDGKQTMTVFKDIRTQADNVAAVADAFLHNGTPASTTTVNNGTIDVPTYSTAIVTVDKTNLKAALIDSGYYGCDFASHAPLCQYIEASAQNNWIHARNWPKGTVVKLKIDDLSNGLGGVDYTATATMGQAPWNPGNPNDIVADFDMGSFKLEVGDVVSISENIVAPPVTKSLTVSGLQVTSLDIAANTISGAATAGANVDVCVNIPNNCVFRSTTATGGTWMVNYTADYDLQRGDNGWAAEYDADSDRTWYDWNIPNPNIQVTASQDRVDGFNWTVGETVTITVSRIGETITRTATVTAQVPWDNRSQPYFYYDFKGQNAFDIKPGDVVTVSQGTAPDVITKTTTVTGLAFTNIDIVNDIVTGVASDNADVHIWVCKDQNCNYMYNRYVKANGSGAWTADFGHKGSQPDEQTTVDLASWSQISLSENDSNGNATMDWVRFPDVEASVQHNWVNARGWPIGTVVKLKIDDLSNGLGGVDYTTTATVGPAPWDPNDLVAQFNMGSFTLAVGDVVSISENVASPLVTKALTVTAFHVTAFDVDADTVSGVAIAGANIDVCVNIPNNCVFRSTTATAGGTWTVDFTSDHDLQPGEDGWALELDADGDQTHYDWNILGAATSLSPGTVYPATPTDIGINYTPTYQWNKVFSATWYRLYVSGASGVVVDQWYEASSICDASVCSVMSGPSATLAGGSYSWYVQTYNAAGYGPWSNNTQPTNFTTTIPSAPAAATSLSPGTVNPATPADIGTNYTPMYSWDKITGATYYHLYVSGPSGVVLDQWYPSASICPMAVCSVASPTLGGGTYSWYVQTYNSVGYGPWSNTSGSVIQPVRFTTSSTPPAAATSLSPGTVNPATPTDIGTNYTPTYSWDKITGATWYRLYVSGPSGVALDQWYQAEVICPSTCSVTSPLLGGGTYSWYVQTYGPAGYGPWSNTSGSVIQPVRFTTSSTPPAAATSLSPGTVNPATPTDIGTNYTPTYSWDKITGATWYRLYVSGPSGVALDQWYQAEVICPSTCSVASPLLGGGTYSWYVQTYGPGGYGPWSNTVGSVIQPVRFTTSSTPPLAATSLSPGTVNPATPADIGTNYTPTYSWDKIAGATYYHLYVSGPSGVVLDQWYQASSICPSTCSVASPLLGGGTYSWYVQTYGPGGYGPWSNTVGSVIQPVRFSTTTTLSAATSLSPGTVNPATPADIGTNYTPTYSWDKITGATWYRLYVSGPGGVVLDQWYQASSICPSTCSVISPLLGGGTYSWYVQTYGPAGYGPWSNTSGSVIQPVRFTTATPAIPAGATLTLPTSGATTASHTPTYTWTKVDMATWYHLYVKGPGGVVVKDQWYQSSSVCIGATCTVVSPTLESGFHTWWIQTYNAAGYGPWKSATFTVSP
jgi:putative multiple sugar transport system substrate-binding protein